MVRFPLSTKFEIEDLPCSVGELQANRAYGGILERLGPADAGLLYMAERERLTLVTEDGPLLNEGYRRLVAVKTLSELQRPLLFPALFFRLAAFLPGFQTLLAALGALGGALHQLGTDQLDHGLLGAVALPGA